MKITKESKKKFLLGLALSLVLAMAIGSFALSETQTPASPRAVEAQSAVGATVGPFTVDGGTQDTDYGYASSVLTIYSGNLTISTNGETTERIVVDGAATITLAGVNIDRTSETEATAPITITDDATFNVNILLADGSTNILKGRTGSSSSSNPGSPGIQKNGSGDSIGTLTIGVPDGSAGTGKLEATGGYYAAGIGGGDNGSGSNIIITGGEVTANGGHRGAGIGGGSYGNGSDITISGGEVTAYGGRESAGIGGGSAGSGSTITINGGEVKATGGRWGAGIGGGSNGSRSNNNSLSGDAVVLATSGDTAIKSALEGFVDAQQESLLTQGIAFTGLGTAFDSDGHATDFSWDESGTMYGDSVTISQNVEFPADLTIGINQSNPQELIVDTNVTLTISAGATLQNEGTLTISGTVDCLDDQAAGTTGEVTTKTDFYREGSTDVYTTGYQTYQTSAGVQKYTNLPNPYQLDPANDKRFINWYYLDQSSQKVAISESVNVLLNEHSFFENSGYTVTVAELENGSITPNVTEAAKDDTVTLTVIPAEGYQLKEGSLTVTDADGNEVPVTEQDGKYTFTMPGADVTVSAEFELISEPSVDPDQGGDGSSKTGDSFTGIAALAILGLATTGASLLRKRK